MSALHDSYADPLTLRPAAAAEPPLASGRDLVVRYGGRTVLDRVSVEVRRREVVSVIGPNGAGKTTTARALLGLIKPDAGIVHHAPGVVVGYVPQRIELQELLPLTVRRFLAMAGRRARSDVAAVLDEVVAAARPLARADGAARKRDRGGGGGRGAARLPRLGYAVRPVDRGRRARTLHALPWRCRIGLGLRQAGR